MHVLKNILARMVAKSLPRRTTVKIVADFVPEMEISPFLHMRRSKLVKTLENVWINISPFLCTHGENATKLYEMLSVYPNFIPDVACDWVMSALSAMLSTRKKFEKVSCPECTCQWEWLWIDPNGKMETRNPVESFIGSEFLVICNHCGVLAAWIRKTFNVFEKFLRFLLDTKTEKFMKNDILSITLTFSHSVNNFMMLGNVTFYATFHDMIGLFMVSDLPLLTCIYIADF